LTLEEKLDLLGGVDGFFIRDVPRLNWPRLKMADGPIGVRNFGPATAFAAGVTLTKVGETYPIACTQAHQLMDEVVIRAGTLAEYHREPRGIAEKKERPRGANRVAG